MLPLSAEQLNGGQQKKKNRFERIVLALAHASPAERRLFAQLAVDNLKVQYSLEAELARSEVDEPSLNTKNLGWAFSVERFTDYLTTVSKALQGGVAPVVITLTTTGSILLSVGSHRLILSHPREAQQVTFEQELLAEFCAGRRCQQLLSENASFIDGQGPLEQQKLHWNFSTQGASCSTYGFTLLFSSTVRIAQIKDFCNKLFAELKALSKELRTQQQQGVWIELSSISLECPNDQGAHLLRLNAVGDAAFLALPVLATSPAFLSLIVEFLVQKSNQQAKPTLELQAVDYGWPVFIQ